MRAPPPRSVEAFESLVHRTFVPRQSPGLCVAAFDRDGTLYLQGYGLADLRRGAPVRPDTAFRWFSVTKVATATAVLQLAERGALSLDAPVSATLPWLRARGITAEGVTPRALLCHAAGVVNPLPASWAHPPGVEVRAGEEFAREVFARNARLHAPPFTVPRYTNLGFLILEALVERAAGRPFRAYLAAEVLDPLGMRDTRVGHDPGLLPRLATGHERLLSPRTLALGVAIPRARQLVDAVVYPWVALRPFGLDGAGYGSLIGTMEDLVRFGRAHLRNGELDGARVLSEASVREMLREQALGFGLAWWRGRDEAGEFVQHGGEGGAYRAELRLYPARGLGFAVLANAGGADARTVVDWMAGVRWR